MVIVEEQAALRMLAEVRFALNPAQIAAAHQFVCIGVGWKFRNIDVVVFGLQPSKNHARLRAKGPEKVTLGTSLSKRMPLRSRREGQKSVALKRNLLSPIPVLSASTPPVVCRTPPDSGCFCSTSMDRTASC